MSPNPDRPDRGNITGAGTVESAGFEDGKRYARVVYADDVIPSPNFSLAVILEAEPVRIVPASDYDDLVAALEALVDAKALAGVRGLVAGWNGENLPGGPHKERHYSELGATLPKTNCGEVYALDEALELARAVLFKASPSPIAEGVGE